MLEILGYTLAGFFGGCLVYGTFCMRQYKAILLMCAKQQTAEKLGNEFYYIVPESAFNDMKRAESILAQGQALRDVRISRVHPPIPHA